MEFVFLNPCISRNNSCNSSVSPSISPWPKPSHKLVLKSDVIACIDMWMDPCPDPCQYPMSYVNQRHFRLGQSIKKLQNLRICGISSRYHQVSPGKYATQLFYILRRVDQDSVSTPSPSYHHFPVHPQNPVSSPSQMHITPSPNPS